MWTYSGNPNSSSIDLVHFRLGDTNPVEPIATDEECAQALADNGGNTWLAAADIAEGKAASFFNRASHVKRGDRLTIYSEQVEGFLAMARSLRMRASVRTTSLYAGGIDAGEKQAVASDDSLTRPFVTKDLHTRPPLPRAQAVLAVERDEQ